MIRERMGNRRIAIILTFIVIFVSNDTLLFGTNSNKTFFGIHVLLLLMCLVYLIIYAKAVKKERLLGAATLILLMIVTQAINYDAELIKYLYNYFMIVLCVFFCSWVSKEDFISAFISIIYCISIFAILLFILWMVVPPIMKSFPSITNESGIRYYYFGLGFLEDLNEGVLPRMYGIFREPGVFACYLVFALMAQLFFIRDVNIRRVIVISIAAVLTFSTAAYLMSIFLFVLYFLKQLMGKYKQKKAVLLLVSLAIAVVLVFVLVGADRIINLVFNKLKVENSSRDSRFGSIEANWKMFMQNPFFGKGWEYVEDNFIFFASQGAFQGHHNTNTFLKLLAIYGIGPSVYLIKNIYSFYNSACCSILWGLIATGIWFIALSNSDLSVNVLFYLIPFYGMGVKKESFA